MAIFDKTDFWGLKDPLEVRVQYETCSSICETPVPAILNHKNSTGLVRGAKNSQNWVFLKVQIQMRFIIMLLKSVGLKKSVIIFIIGMNLEFADFGLYFSMIFLEDIITSS